MNQHPEPDWDLLSDEMSREPLAVFDDRRERCPVAYSERLLWTLFRHEDVVRVLNDYDTFSNAVSSHLAVPSGMDPPEHTEYRRIIDCYFTPERMAAFEPWCRETAADLTRQSTRGGEVEFIEAFALPFALQAQCAFLGWPSELHAPLRVWLEKHHEATRVQDRAALRELAHEFGGYVEDQLLERRESGAPAPDDITGELMRETVFGRPLTDEELISIFRNWTVGEIGTIAAALGILAHFIANDPGWQDHLREQPALIPAFNNEALRIHGPLMANRRITRCPAEVGGKKFDAGERISVNWISANRDGRVFEEPETIRLDRVPSLNLLYGAGIHACPGAPLANLEMSVAVEVLLKHTSRIRPASQTRPAHAAYPAGGFSTLPLCIESNPGGTSTCTNSED